MRRRVEVHDAVSWKLGRLAVGDRRDHSLRHTRVVLSAAQAKTSRSFQHFPLEEKCGRPARQSALAKASQKHPASVTALSGGGDSARTWPADLPGNRDR